MRFLVKIEVRLPAGLPAGERAELLQAEEARGRQLKAEGAIVDVWRIPGRLANVGVWEAADATELHEALCSIPVFAFAEIEVTALARHYLTNESEDA